MSHFERRKIYQEAQRRSEEATVRHFEHRKSIIQPAPRQQAQHVIQQGSEDWRPPARTQLEQFDIRMSLMQASGTDPDSQRRALVRDLTLMQIVQDREMLRRSGLGPK